MKLNITRGRIARPQKLVIYAPEGIGKTTLAAAMPAPLLLDFEQGSHHIDVARVEPGSYKEATAILHELAKGSEFQTVVIDTIDWLEEKLLEHVCKEGGKASIEEFGYGKGFVIAAEEATRLLTLLDRVAEKAHVVLLAHSEVKRQELPDHPAFDRYQLKLSKQIAPIVKEWADALLFGSFKLAVREGDNGKAKGVAARERLLRCCHSATADAKNRHGLKEIEPWSMETIGKILAPMEPPAPVAPAQAAKKPATTPAQVQAAPVPEPEDHVPGLDDGWQAEFLRVVGPYEEQVIGFLVNRNEVPEGQGLSAVSESYARRVLKNPVGFLKAAGIKEVAA
jgi:hypothetical protein